MKEREREREREKKRENEHIIILHIIPLAPLTFSESFLLKIIIVIFLTIL